MNSISRFIGIDLGAESGRIIVAELEANHLSLNEVHRFTTYNYLKDNEFHWDINKIFNEIIIGLKNAVKTYGDEYESLAVDTWGVDYALIDDTGKLLNDPFHYRDDRTDEIMPELFNVIDKEELYMKTGNQNMQFNTIFQLFAEIKSSISNLKKSAKFLLIPDYLNYLLSNKIYAEYTIASTTGLTDQKLREWHWNLIKELDIDKNLFPKILQPGATIGTISDNIAKLTGLKSTSNLVATTEHDTASAVVSAPSRVKNWAFLSSGTWSIMGVEIPNPIINKLAMNLNFANEGGMSGTTRLCKNIIGMWPIQECRRTWLTEDKDLSYPKLTELADQYGYSNSWINLKDNRIVKPGNMPSKIKALLEETNQDSRDEVGYIIRVIVESLAFSYKTVLEEIEKVTDSEIEELNIFGGGIQNKLLCQLTADALNIPVVAGPIEGTIIGNIGVQAIANKKVKDLTEWRVIVSNSFGQEIYTPQNPEYFIKNYNIYKEICNH